MGPAEANGRALVAKVRIVVPVKSAHEGLRNAFRPRSEVEVDVDVSTREEGRSHALPPPALECSDGPRAARFLALYSLHGARGRSDLSAWATNVQCSIWDASARLRLGFGLGSDKPSQRSLAFCLAQGSCRHVGFFYRVPCQGCHNMGRHGIWQRPLCAGTSCLDATYAVPVPVPVPWHE